MKGGPASGVLALVLVLVSPPAGAGEPYRPFRDCAARMAPALWELAEWCVSKKLLRERTGVLEAILLFDADHFGARRGLRYARDRDGTWGRREEYRRPKTTRPEHQPEFRRRRREAAGAFVKEVLGELAARRKEVTGPGMTVNDMSEKDLLHSYALGVFLIAGEPPGRDAFLKAIGEGAHHAEASTSALGLTLPELERRVITWLRELGEE